MRYFFIVFVIVLLQACNTKKDEKLIVSSKTGLKKEDNRNTDSTAQNTKPISEKLKDGQDDVMLAEDIRFNGKTERIFDLKDFEKVFGKPDSIRLMADEEPCSYIF